MTNTYYLYNTLTHKKEVFEPLIPNHVGLYVCGPTVYGDPHLGHARPAITFDVLVRLFRHMGYKVRYVRNITDVGHLEHDADTGEDKIARKARLESLEPMEVVQFYTNRFHTAMAALNTLPPSIEPHASGHIIEQIEVIRQILEAGMAYEVNGSVYFDVEKYDKTYRYGLLSGRVLDQLQANTRALDGQDDKRSPYDFALWKKAAPEHIMRWPSPWSDGFPGWHLECSAMSAKYLGQVFDIHGGGMDLLFPHHECELAQNTVTRGTGSVRYWMHNNLITINGQKMGKSLGNFITLEDLFNGTNPLLTQPFDPMTIRFFILQAHYRGPLDFSNEALISAEKGLKRLLQAGKDVAKLSATDASKPADPQLVQIEQDTFAALCDDLNTPIALSHLFDAVRWLNAALDKKQPVSVADKTLLTDLFAHVVNDILGLMPPARQNDAPLIDGLMQMIVEARNTAKAQKDWKTSDAIRDRLQALGIQIKDTKEGTNWTL